MTEITLICGECGKKLTWNMDIKTKEKSFYCKNILCTSRNQHIAIQKKNKSIAFIM